MPNKSLERSLVAEDSKPIFGSQNGQLETESNYMGTRGIFQQAHISLREGKIVDPYCCIILQYTQHKDRNNLMGVVLICVSPLPKTIVIPSLKLGATQNVVTQKKEPHSRISIGYN